MQLEINKSLEKNLIIPFTQSERMYYVLFLRESQGPFWVRDTSYKIATLINIGEIYTQPTPETKRIVGNIFHAKVPCICEGSFLLAYSGVFAENVQRSLPPDFEMDLVLKERGFQVFNQKNRATLIINPSINQSIKANLEI